MTEQRDPTDTHSALAAGEIPAAPRVPLLTLARRVVTVAAVALLLAWSARGAEIRPGDLVRYSGNMVQYLQGFLRPDFTDWRNYAREMVVTLQIAIWGTFLAVICAVPCGLLSSSNLAPWWLRQPVRRAMDAFRAINEMIFALVFISAIGLGPFAGVLALFVHTLGTLAKLFSEAVEASDPRPVEGVRATGASNLDEIAYGIIPQVMPLWVSYTLYRFEANVRSASVIGLVGAGGIGALLYDAIKGFKYAECSAMLLIIVVTVVLIDLVSGRIRRTWI